MASKTLMEVFSRYLPDGENRRLMESAHLVGNMRVDKNLRMMELDFSSSSLISKSKLYKLEADIAKAYSLRSVRLFPKYPKELFTEGYFSEIMNEAYRTNLISRSFLQEYRAEFHGYQITIEIPFNDGGVNFVEYNHIGKKIADILHREFGLEYEIHFKKMRATFSTAKRQCRNSSKDSRHRQSLSFPNVPPRQSRTYPP